MHLSSSTRTPARSLTRMGVGSACLMAALATSPTAQATGFNALLAAHSGFDRNGDGVDEINSLSAMASTAADPSADDQVVVIFVEDRLLDPIPGAAWSAAELTDRLDRLARDLRADGYTPKLVRTSVYDGAIHQDGETVLAMRTLLQAVQSSYPELAGALLVGDFPEAMLVRRWLWKKDGAGVTIKGTNMAGTEILRMIPERIDNRADIVLADLDGRWDEIYHRDPTAVSGLVATPSGSGWWADGWFTSSQYEWSSTTWEDFFFIDDSQFVDLSAYIPGTDMFAWMNTANRNPELSSADDALTNPLARPDILVSRINPRHVAVEPDPTLTDAAGNGLLSAAGEPQSIQTTLPAKATHTYVQDADFERSLLIDFLDRNHDFRRGGESDRPYRAAAITYPESSSGFFNVADMASYADSVDPGFSDAPLTAPTDPSLVEYVEWLKAPARLRAVTAHSNAWNTAFGGSYSVSDLESETGTPWRWQQSGSWANPSFTGQGGTADLFVHRTLWENDQLSAAGSSFIIHVGCEVHAAGGGDANPYNSPNYANFQNGEAQLFYLNGLAMISRAKTFNDRPQGISAALADERTPFGTVWPGTFDADGDDGALSTLYSSNKRAYNWSLTGDWTLRLDYQGGLGLMYGTGWSLRHAASHADASWIGAWNFDSGADMVHGAGDFNGDGAAEAVITSDWGIGLISFDDDAFDAPLVQADDTWFGAWRYNASFHAEDDVIEAIGDFDGDGEDELLVSSEWGLGILELSGRLGDTFTSLATLEDNHWAGAWRYETSNDIVGVADLDGDGADEIIVQSPWGIGALTLGSRGGFTSLVAQPNDTWFGDWRYNASFHAGDDEILGFGDLDGDGADDILIGSEWGIGVLTLSGTTFTDLDTAANDSWLGSWRYNASFHRGEDRVLTIADLDGDGADDILIGSEWGMGILELGWSGLTTRMTWSNGSWAGWWLVDGDDDEAVGVGDLTGDGKTEVVLQSPVTGDMAMLRGWGSTAYAFYPLEDGEVDGNWEYRSTDRVGAVADLDPSRRGDELLLQR